MSSQNPNHTPPQQQEQYITQKALKALMEETATHAAAEAVAQFLASQQPDSDGNGTGRKEAVDGTSASRVPLDSNRGTTHYKKIINASSTMDFLENVCKKSAKTTVKVGKIMFKTLLRPLFRTMSQVAMATCLQPLTAHHNLKLHDFMTLIIKVDCSRLGWQKGILLAMKNCKGARFKMDQNGVVEISGVGDPKRLLKKLGRSNHVNLLWFQFGQCSENLFMASSSKKSDPPPAQDQSKQQIDYGNNNNNNSSRFPSLANMHAGFPHAYHPTPHFVTHPY